MFILFSLDLERETLLLTILSIQHFLPSFRLERFPAILVKHLTVYGMLVSSGVSGNLLSWFTNYLTGRKQRVMSGVQYVWNFITAGVSQGSILGPLLFLHFKNDIVLNIGSSIRLFADDTSLYIIVEDPNVATELLNADLEKIAEWALKWLVKFNPLKTESLLILQKTNTVHPPVFM